MKWFPNPPIFSLGILVILVTAGVTSILIGWLPAVEARGIQFWVYYRPFRDSYVDKVDEWNRAHPETPLAMTLLSSDALERRTLSGFLAGTPVGDLIALHDLILAKAFLGPVDQVGLLDLTDRLHAEGLYAQINEPSFSPMTSRGRIFALPRDVHPVLLAYRADIVEAAGIDVSEIETWDDYFRVMRPLMVDRDGDGRPDRYLLDLSETRWQVIAMLLLQNDGELFDEQDRPIFASERNAETLARIIPWMTGPGRAAIGIPETAAGHKQMLDGLVVGTLACDFHLGLWKMENPQLAGKIKLMSLPVFEPGGRRTSVYVGSSMVGINKRSAYTEECWEILKALLLSAEVAERAWRETNILSPMKTLWEEPFYHEPDPFYGGQLVGPLYMEAAPHVPHRSSSPYAPMAYSYLANGTMALLSYAEKHEIYDPVSLKPEALRLLQQQQARLEKLISRNVFLEEEGGAR